MLCEVWGGTMYGTNTGDTLLLPLLLPLGWSIDPFGMSSTQAVLQALQGMEAWFFTRVTGSIVDEMKQNQSLEFVWRGSSALPAKDSEIFAHVFESYYCMPLPTYAFEWGEGRGAKIPNKANVVNLAQNLANITKDRAPFFRTKNVRLSVYASLSVTYSTCMKYSK